MKYYKTELIDINSIKINKNNCKLHSSYQLELIKNSIKEFGFTCPLLVDENNNLMAGHGRLEAIKQLNKTDLKSSPITKLPCVCVNGLSDMQKRALIIADNKITECGSYDEDILSFELKELQSIGFDLESIGFNDDELNHLLNQFNVESVNSVNNNFQTFDNKEYCTDDIMQYQTCSLNFKLNIDDYRLVNSVLLNIDKDINKAIVKIIKHYNEL